MRSGDLRKSEVRSHKVRKSKSQVRISDFRLPFCDFPTSDFRHGQSFHQPPRKSEVSTSDFRFPTFRLPTSDFAKSPRCRKSEIPTSAFRFPPFRLLTSDLTPPLPLPTEIRNSDFRLPTFRLPTSPLPRSKSEIPTSDFRLSAFRLPQVLELGAEWEQAQSANPRECVCIDRTNSGASFFFGPHTNKNVNPRQHAFWGRWLFFIPHYFPLGEGAFGAPPPPTSAKWGPPERLSLGA